MQNRIGDGQPIRLFVSGLHGEEHETTDPILRSFSEKISEKGLKGSLILHTLGRENRKYVSTLDDKYWNTETGQDLLHIVEKYRPDIYLELHSYSDLSKLTGPDRIDRKGVPPLVELESGILAGSISPSCGEASFGRKTSVFCWKSLETRIIMKIFSKF